MTPISPSELNRLVNLVSYTYTQNDSGGLTPVIAEQITGAWATVDQLGGDARINQGQDKNFANYKIIVRYRSQMTENWMIVYEGQTMKIKQMQVDDTSYKRFWIIYCSTSIQQQSWS